MVENINQSFGRRARAIRERLDLTREQAAAGLDIAPTSLYRIEKGDQWISPEMLAKLSAFYSVGPDYFFADTPTKPVPTPAEALAVLSAFVAQHQQDKFIPTPGIPDDIIRMLSGADPAFFDAVRAAFEGWAKGSEEAALLSRHERQNLKRKSHK